VSAPRRPPGLLLLACLFAVVTLTLAAEAVVTFPMAVVSATCLALYAVPPEQGMRAKHYQALAGLVIASVVWTYFWQRAWTQGS
jgi:hypothetical protein